MLDLDSDEEKSAQGWRALKLAGAAVLTAAADLLWPGLGVRKAAEAPSTFSTARVLCSFANPRKKRSRSADQEGPKKGKCDACMHQLRPTRRYVSVDRQQAPIPKNWGGRSKCHELLRTHGKVRPKG